MAEAGPGPAWVEPDAELLEMLTRNGCFAADSAVLDAGPITRAEATRVAVRAALRVLAANGMIAVVPREQWPIYMTVHPPAGASS